VFEGLLDRAKRDARAGRDGRCEDVETTPGADDLELHRAEFTEP
jgi:hypothetical protein